MKKVLTISVILLYTLLALGSGDSNEKTTTVTNVDNGTLEVTSNKENPKNDFSYEITNVKEKIEESPYWGKSFNDIIEITNTGDTPIYLDDCVLDYEDDDGHLIQTYDFLSKVPDVVMPKEKGYFYGGSFFDDGIDFNNGCHLIPTVTIQKATGNLKSYETTDVSLYDETYGGVGVRGRIINDTDEEVSYIYLTIVFYDNNGDVLDISGTSVTDIRANAKTSFDCSGLLSDDFSVNDVGSYRIYCDEIYLQF